MPQLTVWTIYHHPSDHPGSWVMRGHEIVPSVGIVRAHDACFVAATLDEIRSYVPPGTRCVGRAPEDNPVIHEMWVAESAKLPPQ
jgi:hypothetical protein